MRAVAAGGGRSRRAVDNARSMPTIDEAFGPRPPLTTEAACKMVVRSCAIVAILVEGWSDQAALEALAHRRGLKLAAERIVILPVGGATNTGKFLEALGPPGLGVRLAGLVDANEEQHLWRDLERVGLGTNLSRVGAEALGLPAESLQRKTRPLSRSSIWLMVGRRESNPRGHSVHAGFQSIVTKTRPRNNASHPLHRRLACQLGSWTP